MNQKNRLEQIRSLKKILKQHEENMSLLLDFAEGRLTLKNKDYTPGAKAYQRTAEDEQRLVWVLHNLKTRMQRDQRELEVLQKSGS